MPIDDKLLSDLDSHIENVDQIGVWLDKVYYNPEFSGFFTRPVVSILIQTVKFLSDNLGSLREKYNNKLKGESNGSAD